MAVLKYNTRVYFYPKETSAGLFSLLHSAIFLFDDHFILNNCKNFKTDLVDNSDAQTLSLCLKLLC